jgi:hypothetical protein
MPLLPAAGRLSRAMGRAAGAVAGTPRRIASGYGSISKKQKFMARSRRCTVYIACIKEM